MAVVSTGRHQLAVLGSETGFVSAAQSFRTETAKIWPDLQRGIPVSETGCTPLQRGVFLGLIQVSLSFDIGRQVAELRVQ